MADDDKEPELPLAQDADEKLFGNDGVPLQPIEIDLEQPDAQPEPVEPEPLAEGGEAEQPKVEAEKPKNRVPYRARINQLRGEIGARDQQIAELQRQLQERDAQTAQLAQRNAESDIARFDQHDVHWHGEQRAAKDALRVAHEKMAAGDPNGAVLVADATERLTAASSEVQAINAFKANHPNHFNADGSRKAPVAQQPRPQPQAQPQPQPQQQPQIDIPEDVAEWVQNNPWINQNSEDFDPEMAQAATATAELLDRRYRNQGKADQIGTKAFFHDLDSEMAKTFPEAYEEQPQPKRQDPKRSPTMNRPNGAAVAPATSRQASATPAVGQPGSEKVRMSVDDQDMALRMGYVYEHRREDGTPDPRAGKRMTDQDALRYHAKHMAITQKKDRALGR